MFTIMLQIVCVLRISERVEFCVRLAFQYGFNHWYGVAVRGESGGSPYRKRHEHLIGSFAYDDCILRQECGQFPSCGLMLMHSTPDKLAER